MTIETILLAVGPNDEQRADALSDAIIEVAEPTGATVILAHVFESDEFDRNRERLARGEEPEALTADQVARRHSTVRTIESRLRDAGIDVEVRGAVGERGPTIVELAEDVGADRVVVGGRDRSPAGKAVFGSTAQEVLLSAPCPVTLVRAN